MNSLTSFAKVKLACLGQTRRRASERGQIATMLALLLPVLLGLAGLVVDGGILMIQFRRGQVTVDSAALAAAARLDEDTFKATNQVTLNAADAYAAALTYGQINGQGHVAITGVQISGAKVRVTGQVTARPLFMRLFGINQVRVTLHSDAELRHGITAEGQ